MFAQESQSVFPDLQATSWNEADQLFRRDPRWLGGDAAYSVDLGGGRVLWLFGDSFIAERQAVARNSSQMVRNSMAIRPVKGFIEILLADAQPETPK